MSQEKRLYCPFRKETRTRYLRSEDCTIVTEDFYICIKNQCALYCYPEAYTYKEGDEMIGCCSVLVNNCKGVL